LKKILEIKESKKFEEKKRKSERMAKWVGKGRGEEREREREENAKNGSKKTINLRILNITIEYKE